MPPHTTTGTADNTLPERREGRGTIMLPLHQQPCERRALDGVAATGYAMKRDSVKRLRQQSVHTCNGAKAEGSFIVFCALSDTTALARAGGLSFILQDA